MRKKLQVFISSTYTDLIDERQAGVEAILNAGHIPAGMELFKSGDESQLETVKRWIDDSDIYLLLVGGRYGSIEPTTGKSYTHLEYEYALEKGMPFFALIMSDEALNDKVKARGMNVIETSNSAKLKEFKDLVLSKICRIFNDNKDIQISIISSIRELEQKRDFAGWISGKDLPDLDMLVKLEQILRENEELKRELNELKAPPSQRYSMASDELDGTNYRFLKELYDVTKGKQNVIVNIGDIGDSLGNEIDKITDYLKGEGFLEYKTMDGGIAITHDGVKYVQKKSKELSKFTELDKVILRSIHNKDYKSAGVPQFASFTPYLTDAEARSQELAYYIQKLARGGYIHFEIDPFVSGGRSNPRYNNNVITIMFDKIRITEEGEQILDYL